MSITAVAQTTGTISNLQAESARTHSTPLSGQPPGAPASSYVSNDGGGNGGSGSTGSAGLLNITV